MNDIFHEILQIRKQCLLKIEDDDRILPNLFEELLQWQDEIIQQLKKFIRKKFDEIKNKYQQIYQQRIRQLDALYFNCLSHQVDEQKQQTYIQFIQKCQKNSLPIEISFPKSIDFNDYLQLNTDRLNELQRSLTLLNTNNPQLDLTTYRLISNLSIQSNLTPLLATDDRLLIYYDHHTSSPSLHIFNLKNYLRNNKMNSSTMKLRIPCHQFQGKLMHMEYCSFIHGFLLATGSKLFILQISNTVTDYTITESFDIIQRKFSGILQKFACHLVTSNLIFLLLKTLTTDYRLIQIDLSKSSRIRKHCNYPKDDHSNNDIHLNNINDFVFGNERLIFAVTYQSNKKDDYSSYEIHIRSLDMELICRFPLNSMHSPLKICMIPSDYSASEGHEQEQFLIIYHNSKILSFYGTNVDHFQEENIQLIDEIILEIEPEYIDFAFNDSSILILRTPFHLSIYKQLNHPLTEQISIGQRASSVEQFI